MVARESKEVIYAAIVANLAIAICKYVAAALTHRSTMLAEALHSTADTGSELLLLVGMKRSTRPPDELHPHGHGKALYILFSTGGCLRLRRGRRAAVHHGITHLRNPQIADHPGWNYAVLGISGRIRVLFLAHFVSRTAVAKSPDESTWDEIIGSKDPTIFTVLLEDAVGLLGAVIAFLGIFLARLLKHPDLDSAASIVIGVLLAAVAIFLGRECGALLIGERTNRARIRRVREISTADPAVGKVLGPSQCPAHGEYSVQATA